MFKKKDRAQSVPGGHGSSTGSCLLQRHLVSALPQQRSSHHEAQTQKTLLSWKTRCKATHLQLTVLMLINHSCPVCLQRVKQQCREETKQMCLLLPPPVHKLHGLHCQRRGNHIVSVVSPPTDHHQPLHLPHNKHEAVLRETQSTYI